jgi:hypothetical protein
MTWTQVIETSELLDTPSVNGTQVASFLQAQSRRVQINVSHASGAQGQTDFVRVFLPGANGKNDGGDAPTLGIIGRIGGIGARPARTGFVSDGDGALAVIACAAKLARMLEAGDRVEGDVILATHICPEALIVPHEPVPLMASPVSMADMNRHEVDPRMEAILCVDPTRANRIVNRKGFAISPTVKEGYILRVSEDLLDVMEVVTGLPPVVFPLAHQDITPYDNGLHHLNSIMQPSLATTAPTVGVALTSVVPVAGSATGASQVADVEAAVRFCVEVAVRFGRRECHLYDADEFQQLVSLYGPLNRFQGHSSDPSA